MLGPVVVSEALPGDVIECRLEALRTRDLGRNSFPLGVGALPADFSEPYVHYFRFDDARRSTEYVQGIELELAPFLGVMAVEPAGDAAVSAVLSGPDGGNLVLRELTVGSSLYLPVAKPGARLWMGDVHALQGDGVVDQTAIETAAEDLKIRYDCTRASGSRVRLGRRGRLDRHRLRGEPRRRSCLVPSGAHLVAARGGGNLRRRGVRTLQHGCELSGHAVLPPNRVRLQLDSPESGPRDGAQGHLSRDIEASDRALAAPPRKVAA